MNAVNLFGGMIAIGLAMLIGPAVRAWARPRPRPTLHDLTLQVERETGLVFDGVFLIPGYFVYEKRLEHFGFTCRECGGGTYFIPMDTREKFCACGGRDIDRDDLGWLVRPEFTTEGVVRGFRVTPANELYEPWTIERAA